MVFAVDAHELLILSFGFMFASQPKISVIVPVFNEEENIRPLYEELTVVLSTMPATYEIIFVDDGSADRSRQLIEQIAQMDKNVRGIFLKRNFGQTAALAAGIDHARGDIIITMDADLQNDPADIPRLIEKLEREGLDVVSGWRHHRRDEPVRVLVSCVANAIIRWLSGVNVHDLGCTLKAYRRQSLRSIQLIGDTHRFLPVLAHWQGYRVGEMEVNHRPRLYGSSKYNLMGRLVRVVLDLVFLKFLVSYSGAPIRFFGGLALILIGTAAVVTAIVAYQKVVLGVWVHKNPLFIVAVVIFLTAIQLLSVGLIMEVVMRNWWLTSHRKPYVVEREV